VSMSEQQRIEQNVRRTVGISTLRKLGGIVDAENEADTAKPKLIRYALTALLLLICMILPCFIAYRLGVI
jgi:hypothetical protein